MSYRLKISQKARETGLSVFGMVSAFQKAFARKRSGGLTQQKVAEKLGINRAVVNRRLLGRDNMTMTTLAEMAWALDHELRMYLIPKTVSEETNVFSCDDGDLVVRKAIRRRDIQIAPRTEVVAMTVEPAV